MLEETEIIVVVDGFIEESGDVIEKHPGVSFVDLQTNHGMQYAINYGAMLASGNLVLVINDDNVFGKDWDDILEAEASLEFGEGRDRWCLTVDQVEPTGPSMFRFHIHDLGKNPDEFDYDKWLTLERNISEEESSHTHRTYNGQIFPFLMTRSHYLAVNGLDTFFNSPNVCDWDFFMRLEILGFEFSRIHSTHLYHFGSVATKKNADANVFREKETKARGEFMVKWGFEPYNHPGSNAKIPAGTWL